MNYDPQERRIREALDGVMDVTEYEVERVKGQPDFVTVSGFCVEGEKTMESPDPETEKMLEELESKKADPDALLLEVMENVRDAIVNTIAEAEEWGASTAQMLEVDEKVNDLAETALDIYKMLEAKRGLGEARSMMDKLNLMREVERRNDERIKEWSEKQ